jgi:hypothetical protein
LGLGGGPVLGWCLFGLMLEFKFSSFILNERSGLFKIKCVGKNTPQLIIIIPIFSEQHS